MSATWQEMAQFDSWFPSLVSAHAANSILNLLNACGSQSVAEIYREVRIQVVGVDDSNFMEISNNAIATLIDYHLIEKWEYQEDDGTMVDYYDLPEDDNDD